MAGDPAAPQVPKSAGLAPGSYLHLFVTPAGDVSVIHSSSPDVPTLAQNTYEISEGSPTIEYKRLVDAEQRAAQKLAELLTGTP